MAEVVASLFARPGAATELDVRHAIMAGADWLELRLDHWPVARSPADWIGEIPVPVIATCRMPRDQGFFPGTLEERRLLLEEAIRGGATAVDVEDWESWQPPRRDSLRFVIRSHHNWTGIPRELAKLQRTLFAAGADIVKIVGTAPDLADAAPLLTLLERTGQEQRPTVAFAIGRTAWPTRILGAMLEAPFVYTAARSDEPTAPEQPALEPLTTLYRVHELSRHTELFGLLGNPALHSHGPWVHNRALRSHGLDAVYLPFETARPEEVVAMLRQVNLRGLSVTAPFKAELVRLCDELEPSAEATGVVNTLLFDPDGHLRGENTDLMAVLVCLRDAGIDPVATGGTAWRVAILGGGGAARAAAVACRELGFEVTMFTRSQAGLRELAQREQLALAALSAERLSEFDPDIVIQATPVGGLAAPDERLVPEWRPRPGTIAVDFVYRPRRTRWLEDAAAAGARTIDGRQLFLEQAAEQFAIFTGCEVERSRLLEFLAGS